MVALGWYVDFLMSTMQFMLASDLVMIYPNVANRGVFWRELKPGYEAVKLCKTLNKNFIMTMIVDQYSVQNEIQNNTHQRFDNSLFLINSSDVEVRALLLQIFVFHNIPTKKWVIFIQNQLMARKILHGTYVPLDFDVLTAEIVGTRVLFHELNNVNSVNGMNDEKLGEYSPRLGFTMVKPGLFPNRRTNFHQAVLRAAVYKSVPYTEVIRKNRVNTVGGLLGRIWNELELELNMRTVYVTTDRIMKTSILGSTDVTRLLYNRDVDVGLCALTVSSRRQLLIDFTIPILQDDFVLIIRKTTTDILWSSWLHPFSAEVWLIIIAYIIMSTLLSQLLHWLKKSMCANCQHNFNVTLFQIVSNLQQQGTVLPPSLSCRMIYTSMSLLAIVLNAAYAAQFISYLTVQEYTKPFNSLAGILGTSYTLGLRYNTFQYQYFQETNTSLILKLRSKHLDADNELPIGNFKGIQDVCVKPKYAYLESRRMVDYFAPIMDCSFHQIQTPMSGTMALGLQKGSPYRSEINYRLLKMLQYGIINRIIRSELKPQARRAETEFNPASLNDTIPICLCLVVGFILSIIILLIEINLHRKTWRDKRFKLNCKI